VRLFLDQMFHLDLAVRLRAEGHDVVHVADLARSRADDEEVLQLASSDDRVLITRDGDFGDWTVLPLHEHAGVIRVETKPTTSAEAAAVLAPFLATVRQEDFRNHLVIVSRNKVRRIRTA
jgi:predicted nuclease of predicted toxin-antitoxin system